MGRVEGRAGGGFFPGTGPAPTVSSLSCNADRTEATNGRARKGRPPPMELHAMWRRCRPDPEPSPPPLITLPDSRRASRVLPRTRAGSIPHVRVGTGRARPVQRRGTRRAAPSKENSANGGRRGPPHVGTHPGHRRPLKETPRGLSARPGLRRKLTPPRFRLVDHRRDAVSPVVRPREV